MTASASEWWWAVWASSEPPALRPAPVSAVWGGWNAPVPPPWGGMPVYYTNLLSSIFLTSTVNLRSFLILNHSCESFGLLPPNGTTSLLLKNFSQSRRLRNASITVHKLNTINFCPCSCLWELSLRDSAANKVLQALMKRQRSETRWQTLSAAAAGIRFYLQTDVMVMDTGVQPPASHSHYWFCRDIFQSNQRRLKASQTANRISFCGGVNWRVSHANVHVLLSVGGWSNYSGETWESGSPSGSPDQPSGFTVTGSDPIWPHPPSLTDILWSLNMNKMKSFCKSLYIYPDVNVD